jgi:mycofactocin system glycosyltransferase
VSTVLPVVPLPAGFGIELDPGTVVVQADVLFGGSPPRLLRLSAAGVRALRELRAQPVGSAAGGRLARTLTDAGLAHPRPPALGQPPDVTVVIPVRDRPAGLDRCLSALGGRYPVIVVDDGSADEAAVTRICAAHGALRRRRPAPGGPAAARNDGLAIVSTPLAAFVDSDCIPGPGWITALAAHFADPMIGAVAPRVRPVTSGGTTGRYLQARSPVDLGPREARVAPLTRMSYVPTAALLVRRDAAASGFDPALRYGEDVDLIWRMISAGWRVRYDPGVVVSHCEPEGRARVLARRFRYGTSAAPLARRHPGQVPPLILQAGPAAAVAAALAGRPLSALGAYGASAAQLARLLHDWGIPATGMLRPLAASVQQTWLDTGRYAIQYALPLVAAGIAWPGGGSRPARRRRRLALASLLAGPPVAAWLGSAPRARPAGAPAAGGHPPLGPFVFMAAYLADEAAYGAGVYRGAIAERLAEPLLPRIAWRPLPRPAQPRPAQSRPAQRPAQP